VQDNTYDAVYSVEATCHAPDKVGVYSELFRVLKPGGLYATYEWVVTESFDENDPDHIKIKKGTPPFPTHPTPMWALFIYFYLFFYCLFILFICVSPICRWPQPRNSFGQ
jgi:SAM-dependent methyltransferase